MRYPVANFKDNWYIAQEFGLKLDYGFHEGCDINLKSGGDTDLGQPIYAIADGIVTSVHNHTTKPTFGNHIHYMCVGVWGTIWDHHAHCETIFVKEGDVVKEGQLIATVGKSGTGYAHDHWAIKVKSIGADTLAKTQEQLTNWTDPISFVEKWMSYIPPMEDKRPYWFDLMNKVIWDKPHEELTDEMVKSFVSDYPSQLKRSGEYDKVVQYIKDDPSIDTNSVSAQELINIIGGLRGDAKRAREEAEVARQEVANRIEQVGRLEAQLLESQKLLSEASRSNLPYLDKIKILEGRVDTLSKEKGTLLIDLAKCRNSQEVAKKNLIQKVTDFINSIWQG